MQACTHAHARTHARTHTHTNSTKPHTKTLVHTKKTYTAEQDRTLLLSLAHTTVEAPQKNITAFGERKSAGHGQETYTEFAST